MVKNKLTKNNKGFSLVELIVVIAIMAVLVGVLAPQFIKYVEKSRVSTDIQNVEEVKTAIQTYAAENGYTGETWTIGSTETTQSFTPQANGTIAKSLADAGLSSSLSFKSKNWASVSIVVDATKNRVLIYGTNGTGNDAKTLTDGGSAPAGGNTDNTDGGSAPAGDNTDDTNGGNQ